MKSQITIGALAQAAGVGVETVRFYERKGILAQPERNGAFRHYPEGHIAKIKFIKRAQELGFTLKESKELLDLKVKNKSKCADVLTKTEEKILEIENKIKDLKKMKKSLQKLSACCEAREQSLVDCPILESF